jgi:hypothetical protein
MNLLKNFDNTTNKIMLSAHDTFTITPDTGGDGLKYCVVVAPYSEDLGWLSGIAHLTHVHIKGADVNARQRRAFRSWTNVPNVGREVETYLHHIMCMYHEDRPDEDIIVFVQGDISDHLENEGGVSPLEFIRRLVSSCAGRSAMSSLMFQMFVPYHFMHASYFGKNLDPVSMCFGDWMVWYAEAAIHQKGVIVPFYKNGLFAMGRDALKRRSHAYFSRIRDKLRTLDPETGHYLERAWAYIFSVSQ